MFTANYRRIYFNHLKKCGGSTINGWLDSLTFDGRAVDEAAWRGISVAETPSEYTGLPPGMAVRPLGRALFHWNDVVHRHRPLRMCAPANTFCFTVLRKPVQRLVSQVLDWYRLSEVDTRNSPANIRACVEDSRRLSLRDFLLEHGRHGGRLFLDNYLTRALAAGRVGGAIANVTEPAKLAEIALQSLESDYDLIGLTEELKLSRNALCATVGLPPARPIPTINAASPGLRPSMDLDEARDVLESLTRVDHVIYDRARQLFDRRHRQAAEAYDTAAFETHHASRLLAEARGHFHAGATRYSVRDPLIGAGFHGRDGTGTPSCAGWSGPETRMTLYIPTPSDMALSLLVWIRGYADRRQRDQIRVRVDGRPADHTFEAAPNHHDLLTVEARSNGDFVRLDIDIDETLCSGELGLDGYDSRLRGISFDSYGWRPTL